jgi:hypothetical protein
MEVERPVAVSVTDVQGTAQVTLFLDEAVLEEAVLVEHQDMLCMEWLRDNGLGRRQ